MHCLSRQAKHVVHHLGRQLARCSCSAGSGGSSRSSVWPFGSVCARPCPNGGRGRDDMPRRFSSCRYASNAIFPSATTTRTRGSAASSASRCGRQLRDLLGRRLVVGRRAAHGRRDVSVAQRQPVVAMLRRRDVREAGAMQRRHQEVARAADAVAGEHAAGPVGAVRGRREADDEQPGARIAEAGNRPGPVGLVAIRAPLLASDARAVRAQARTALAGDDLVVDHLQGGSRVHRRRDGLGRSAMLHGVHHRDRLSIIDSRPDRRRRGRSGRGVAKSDKNECITTDRASLSLPRADRLQLVVGYSRRVGQPTRRLTHAAASDVEGDVRRAHCRTKGTWVRETHCPERRGGARCRRNPRVARLA